MLASGVRRVRRVRADGVDAILACRPPRTMATGDCALRSHQSAVLGAGAFFALIALVILLRDPWQRERPRHERVGLLLLVLGSPVVWFASLAINDAYHLLR